MAEAASETVAEKVKKDAPKQGFFANLATKFLSNQSIIDAASARIRGSRGRQRGQVPTVAAAVTKDIKNKMIVALLVGALGTAVLFFFLKAGLFVSLLVGIALFIGAPVVLK